MKTIKLSDSVCKLVKENLDFKDIMIELGLRT